ARERCARAWRYTPTACTALRYAAGANASDVPRMAPRVGPDVAAPPDRSRRKSPDVAPGAGSALSCSDVQTTRTVFSAPPGATDDADEHTNRCHAVPTPFPADRRRRAADRAAGLRCRAGCRAGTRHQAARTARTHGRLGARGTRQPGDPPADAGLRAHAAVEARGIRERPAGEGTAPGADLRGRSEEHLHLQQLRPQNGRASRRE